MDVAGGNSREGSLAYLTLSEARRLRDLLLNRRDELGAKEAPALTPTHGPAPTAAERVLTPGAPPTGSEQATEGAAGSGLVQGETSRETAEPARDTAGPGREAAEPSRTPAGPRPTAVVAPERRIAVVDLGMLVLSIILSAETIAMVLISLGLAAAFAASGQFAGFSAILPVLLGFGLAMFRKFSANYGFNVSETPAGMQIRRGLFELNAQTIALKRVQGVVVSEPLLWRRLGWARLDVSIAGYGGGVDDDRAAPSTVLPVGRRELVHQVAQHVMRGLDPEAVPLTPVPPRARWAAPVTHRFLSVGADEQLVVSREGWLVRRTHAAPQARIQSVRLTQGPWQRRLGLADVHTDSPPGPTTVRARHRDAAEARRLFGLEVETTARARQQQR